MLLERDRGVKMQEEKEGAVLHDTDRYLRQLRPPSWRSALSNTVVMRQLSSHVIGRGRDPTIHPTPSAPCLRRESRIESTSPRAGCPFGVDLEVPPLLEGAPRSACPSSSLSPFTSFPLLLLLLIVVVLCRVGRCHSRLSVRMPGSTPSRVVVGGGSRLSGVVWTAGIAVVVVVAPVVVVAVGVGAVVAVASSSAGAGRGRVVGDESHTSSV